MGLNGATDKHHRNRGRNEGDNDTEIHMDFSEKTVYLILHSRQRCKRALQNHLASDSTRTEQGSVLHAQKLSIL